MAKAKKKRLAKEIDKHWNAGRYWDWLRLVEQENLVKAQSAQWQEAWRQISRRALRRPDHLEEFWQRLGDLKHLPQNPDIVLLRHLKDFWGDEDVRTEIAAMTGLSPAAHLLREKILSWSWEPAQEKKCGKIINLLLNQPEKVTGRTYAELGTLLPLHPLSASLPLFSKAIAQVRRLNSKSATGNPHWVGRSDRDLKILDSRLESATRTLDPVLREVLLQPFVSQAVQFFTRLAAREDFAELAHLAAVTPFLFSQAAGPQGEHLKNRCRQLTGAFASEAEARDYLKQARGQDLETQVAALGKVRLALTALDPSENLLQEFYASYLSVLDGINQRQPELSPRDRIDLMRVMDPILFRDLKWLPDDPFEYRHFLIRSIDAGCGGALLCTLALLELGVDRSLKQKSMAVLKKLPYPGDQQITLVLENLAEKIFPDARLIKPLLEVYPTETNLRKLLFDSLLHEFKMFLCINAMTMEFEKLVNLKPCLSKDLHETLAIFKKDLTLLADYQEVVVLKDLADCFPEGYLTASGCRNLFQRIYERRPAFDQLFSQLNAYFLSAPAPSLHRDEMLFSLAAGVWLDRQEELLFQFVMDHRADLGAASLAAIEMVIDRFCRPEFMEAGGLNFFLFLNNRLEARLKAGELPVKALQNRIMSLLVEFRQGRTKKKRTRK